VRRRWLRLRGEDDLSLWPWIATMVGGLAILNPYGLDIIGQAISYGPTNWLRDMVRTIALGGVAALLGMVFLETYIRGRMLRRRLAQAG
jgi:H+/Cl- antiporter ClcA